MNIFRSITKKKKKVESLADLGLDNPLMVVPVIEAGVEANRDDEDRIQLHRLMAPKPGIYAWVSKILKYKHEIHINLDEQGTFYWDQIDGQKTLDGVAWALVKKFSIDIDNARKSVIAFTKSLMLRQLVYLIVPSK